MSDRLMRLWRRCGFPSMAGTPYVLPRYLRPLLDKIDRGDIDPSYIITHRMTLANAPQGYKTFWEKNDSCVKVVMTP